MKWTKDAETAIKKVPFFVRKRVKKRVETHAGQKGKVVVELSEVNELKEKFLSKGGMEKEIRGYDVSTCFGEAGCPNSAAPAADLAKDIEALLNRADILGFLKQHVKGDLKFHHEVRVVLADCPNACSRPQIADIGIIGASVPEVTPEVNKEPCSACFACVEACDENAIAPLAGQDTVQINEALCLKCKKCIQVCPTGTIKEKQAGFRVLLGGRLGRHPRLGLEIDGLKSHDEVLAIVRKSIEFYKIHSKNGQRFSHLLSSVEQITE